LIKLLLHVLFEKYIYTLAPEMASPGNWHCANCIGSLLFPIKYAILTTKPCKKLTLTMISTGEHDGQTAAVIKLHVKHVTIIFIIIFSSANHQTIIVVIIT